VAGSRLSELNFSKLNGDHLLKLVQEQLKPGARCVDFGAGEGELLEKLLARGFATSAYDPVGERISGLQERFESDERFLGIIGPASSQRFDVAFMVEVIEHILEPDLHEAIRSIRSLLANGGTLILTTPDAEDLDLAAAYCPQCDTLFHRWQHQRSFTKATLSALLTEHGFETQSIQSVDFSTNRVLRDEIDRLKQKLRQRTLFGPVRRLVGRCVERNQTRNGDTLLYIGRKT